MANTNGGTIYVGIPADPKAKPEGVREPHKAIETLQTLISKRFSPEPQVVIDSLPTQGATVMRISVTPGPDAPYAIDHNQFYVRDESETTLAVRDEIVRMVERNLTGRVVEQKPPAEPVANPTPPPSSGRKSEPTSRPTPANGRGGYEHPRTGVEHVDSTERDGVIYHTLRDLRNGNLINNVTRSSARRLWHYAITQVETAPPDLSVAQWRNNVAILNRRQKNNNTLYDLAVREGDRAHIYYGVTESGLSDALLALVNEQARE